jgi:hypothetical protein
MRNLILLLILTTTTFSSLAQTSPNKKSDSLKYNCPNTPEIEKIIAEAISLGAPIYNEGLHLACYRIYEWASYKIVYEYPKSCPLAANLLKLAIEKSHGDLSDTEKAWLMRAAFDKIVGVPTETGIRKDEPPLPKKG